MIPFWIIAQVEAPPVTNLYQLLAFLIVSIPGIIAAVASLYQVMASRKRDLKSAEHLEDVHQAVNGGWKDAKNEVVALKEEVVSLKAAALKELG